jgi:hypothetical protein
MRQEQGKSYTKSSRAATNSSAVPRRPASRPSKRPFAEAALVVEAATVPLLLVPEAAVAVGADVITWFEPGFVAVTVTWAARLEAVAWL